MLKIRFTIFSFTKLQFCLLIWNEMLEITFGSHLVLHYTLQQYALQTIMANVYIYMSQCNVIPSKGAYLWYTARIRKFFNSQYFLLVLRVIDAWNVRLKDVIFKFYMFLQIVECNCNKLSVSVREKREMISHNKMKLIF